MNQYKAKITKVQSSDVYDANVSLADLGIDIDADITLKLAGVCLPRIDLGWTVTDSERKRGMECLNFVRELIEGKTVTIQSTPAPYVIANITLGDGRDLANLLKEAGFSK